MFFVKQKTAYERRISDWSADVCSSDLRLRQPPGQRRTGLPGTDDDRVEAAGVVHAATVTIGSAAGTATGPAIARKPATAPTGNANRLLAMSTFLPRIRHAISAPPPCPSQRPDTSARLPHRRPSSRPEASRRQIGKPAGGA